MISMQLYSFIILFIIIIVLYEASLNKEYIDLTFTYYKKNSIIIDYKELNIYNYRKKYLILNMFFCCIMQLIGGCVGLYFSNIHRIFRVIGIIHICYCICHIKNIYKLIYTQKIEN